jgi:hypothetical protein
MVREKDKAESRRNVERKEYCTAPKKLIQFYY